MTMIHQQNGRGVYKHMPNQDFYTLGPLAKWRKYGRFPFKLLCHISLLIVITVQITLQSEQNSSYYRSSNMNFYRQFFPGNTVQKALFELGGGSSILYMYQIPETIKSVSDSVHKYYTLAENSVDYYGYGYDCNYTAVYDNSEITNAEKVRSKQLCKTIQSQSVVKDSVKIPQPVLLRTTSYDNITDTLNPNTPFNADMLDTISYITEQNMGPFNHSVWTSGTPIHLKEKIANYFVSLVEFSLTFRLHNWNFGAFYHNCMVWEVVVTYSFNTRAALKVTLDAKVIHSCNGKLSFKYLLWSRLLWMNFAALILAFILQILILRSILHRFNIFMSVRSSTLNAIERGSFSQSVREINLAEAEVVPFQRRWNASWFDLKMSDQIRFFDLWFLFSIGGTVFVEVACFENVFRTCNQEPISTAAKFSLGFGCALLWTCVLKYLEGNASYSGLILTLRRGVPRVLRFLVGVLPVLFAYAVFGMSYFGELSTRFADFGSSMVTLFAILNGDVIRETFLDLTPFYPTVGQIYLYSFISLFIYVVLNVFIAIIEESFFMIRQELLEKKNRRRKSMIDFELLERNANQNKQSALQKIDHKINSMMRQWNRGSGTLDTFDELLFQTDFYRLLDLREKVVESSPINGGSSEILTPLLKAK